MPRRRRGARAAAIEAAEERGFLLRMFLHRPKDMIAGLLAAAAVSAVITNALFLQAGRPPSPMFGAAAPAQPLANPLPRPRPVEAAARSIEPPAVEQRMAELKPSESRPVEPRPADAMTSLVAKTTAPAAPAAVPPVAGPSAAVMRPPAPVPL